jgi:hypothetical protein
MFLAAEYTVYAPHDALPWVMTATWTIGILLAALLFRRPSGGGVDACSRRVASAGHGIVSLSCSRCGRVLELPRDTASRQLFCPRCGSTLPRCA